MIRRSPTRIELRLDDMQDWDKRREVEARKQATSSATPGSSATAHKKQDPTHERHERIGFVPQPRIS